MKDIKGNGYKTLAPIQRHTLSTTNDISIQSLHESIILTLSSVARHVGFTRKLSVKMWNALAKRTDENPNGTLNWRWQWQIAGHDYYYWSSANTSGSCVTNKRENWARSDTNLLSLWRSFQRLPTRAWPACILAWCHLGRRRPCYGNQEWLELWLGQNSAPSAWNNSKNRDDQIFQVGFKTFSFCSTDKRKNSALVTING